VAGRQYTREELAAELEQRDCRYVKNGPNGYTFWESHTGEPFSVPPPEEVDGGVATYPESLLDDLIRELQLPPKKAKG
jgi:hypothetical protein